MRLLFIHMGKTGGKTIRNLLNKQKKGMEYDCIHNKVLIRREAGEFSRFKGDYSLDFSNYELIAYFVRNPYERLKSCYEYFVKGGLNQYAGDFIPGDEIRQKRILKEFPDFESCCHNLADFCELVPHANPMTDSLHEFPAEIPVFQGRYENYEDDVLGLFTHLSLSLAKEDISRTNVSENRERLIYSDGMKNSVYNYYQDDFHTFGYKK